MLEKLFKKKPEELESEKKQESLQTVFSQLSQDYKFKKSSPGYSIKPTLEEPLLNNVHSIEASEIETDSFVPQTELSVPEFDTKNGDNIAVDPTDLSEPEPAPNSINLNFDITQETGKFDEEAKINNETTVEIMKYALECSIDMPEIAEYQKQYSNEYILAQLKYFKSRIEAAEAGTASPILNNSKWLSLSMPVNYAKYDDGIYTNDNLDLSLPAELDLEEATANNEITMEDIKVHTTPIIEVNSVNIETFAIAKSEAIPDQQTEPAVLYNEVYIPDIVLYNEKNNKFATKWHYIKSLSALELSEYLINHDIHCNKAFCVYHDVCIHRIQNDAIHTELCKKGIISNLNTVIPIQ